MRSTAANHPGSKKAYSSQRVTLLTTETCRPQPTGFRLAVRVLVGGDHRSSNRVMVGASANEEVVAMQTEHASPHKALKTDEPLPAGWSAHLDPATGATYYWNASLGATSWERPSAAADTSIEADDPTNPSHAEYIATKASNASTADLYSKSILGSEPSPSSTQSKWVKHSDPDTGVPYFFNTLTNETQWEVPTEGFIDATVFGPTASTTGRTDGSEASFLVWMSVGHTKRQYCARAGVCNNGNL